MKRKESAALASAAVLMALVISLLGVAPHARAAERPEAGTVSATTQAPVAPDDAATDGASVAAAAPWCVPAWPHTHFWSKHVHVRNDCWYPVRVKVIIAFGPDSSCRYLRVDESWTYPHQYGRFDGLVSC